MVGAVTRLQLLTMSINCFSFSLFIQILQRQEEVKKLAGAFFCFVWFLIIKVLSIVCGYCFCLLFNLILVS